MVSRSTDLRSALRSRQRGFLLNPYRFGSGITIDDIPMVFRGEADREPVLSNGDPVPQMTDWSGNGNHAVQANPALQPTYMVGAQSNGVPAIAFNGLGQFLQTASIPSMNNTDVRWYYVVAKYLGFPNVVNGLFAGSNSAAGNIGDLFYYLNNAGPNLFGLYSFASGSPPYSNQSFGSPPPTGAFRAFVLALDGTTALRRVSGYGAISASQTAGPINGTFSLILGDLVAGSGSNGSNVAFADMYAGAGVLTAPMLAIMDAYTLAKNGVSP